MADNKNLILAVSLILLAILIGSGLFSIFQFDIPIATTTAACTGTLSTGPIGQADCLGSGPVAAGSSLDGGWGFSTSGEGTITLPASSNSFILSGDARGFGGSGTVQIFNYATNTFEEIGFTYDSDNSIGTETKNFSKNYIDPASSTIIKFKWILSCPASQCARGIEQLRVTQYDTIDVTTTVPTTTIPVVQSQTKSGIIFANDASLGILPWSNINNLAIEDDLAAAVNISLTESAQFLTAKDFGFTIPSDAIIDGILLEVRGKRSLIFNGGGTGISEDFALIKDVTNQKFRTNKFSDDGSFGTTTFAYQKRGKAVDLWGTTWAPGDINSPNFGFGFRVRIDSGASTYNYKIDFAKITVYYTIPSTTTSSILITTSSISTTSTVPTTSVTTTTSPTTTIQDCLVYNAQWNILSATQGDPIELQVQTSGCSGETIHFSVVEDDSLDADDPANSPSPPNLIIPSDNYIARTIWTAEWQNDCDGSCNPPEYAGTGLVNLIGGGTISSTTANLLTTSQLVIATTTSTQSTTTSILGESTTSSIPTTISTSTVASSTVASTTIQASTSTSQSTSTISSGQSSTTTSQAITTTIIQQSAFMDTFKNNTNLWLIISLIVLIIIFSSKEKK